MSHESRVFLVSQAIMLYMTECMGYILCDYSSSLDNPVCSQRAWEQSMLKLLIGVLSTVFVLFLSVIAIETHIHEWALRSPPQHSPSYFGSSHCFRVFLSTTIYIKLLPKFKQGYVVYEIRCTIS